MAGGLSEIASQIGRNKLVDLGLLAAIGYVTVKGFRQHAKLSLISAALWYAYRQRKLSRQDSLAGVGYLKYARKLSK